MGRNWTDTQENLGVVTIAGGGSDLHINASSPAGTFSNKLVLADLRREVDGVLNIQGSPGVLNTRQVMVTVWENDTDYTDADGRPPHSVEALVLGGTNEAVARAVWAAKAAGIASYGSTSATFTDSRGVSRTASFSRPTSLLMYATVEVEVDPAAYEGEAAVKAAIVAATASYRAGETALISDLVLAVRALPGVVDAYVWIGTTSTFYAQSRSNYTPTARARCVFDTGRVVVTVR
jgi:hypothetical protein